MEQWGIEKRDLHLRVKELNLIIEDQKEDLRLANVKSYVSKPTNLNAKNNL